jgi:hypothetical protein
MSIHLHLQSKRTEQDTTSSNRHSHHTCWHRHHHTATCTPCDIPLNCSCTLSWRHTRARPPCRRRPSTSCTISTSSSDINDIPDPKPLYIPMTKRPRSNPISIPPNARIQPSTCRTRCGPRRYASRAKRAFLIQRDDVGERVVYSPDGRALSDFPWYAGLPVSAPAAVGPVVAIGIATCSSRVSVYASRC